MAFKVSDVVSRVRDARSDSIEDYRWEDPELWRYIDDGVIQIVSRNPESQYEDFVEAIDTSPVTSPDDTIEIERHYMDSLVHYVNFRALSKDSEDNANMALGQDHFAKFVAFLE